jgi:hypothetical protein
VLDNRNKETIEYLREKIPSEVKNDYKKLVSTIAELYKDCGSEIPSNLDPVTNYGACCKDIAEKIRGEQKSFYEKTGIPTLEQRIDEMFPSEKKEKSDIMKESYLRPSTKEIISGEYRENLEKNAEGLKIYARQEAFRRQ